MLKGETKGEHNMARKKSILIDMQELKQTIANLQGDKRAIGLSLFQELEFMQETLKTLKETIQKEGPTAMFKQGSQEFMRENPALQAYNKTVQRYGVLYKQLNDLLPTEETKSDELLDFIKA